MTTTPQPPTEARAFKAEDFTTHEIGGITVYVDRDQYMQLRNELNHRTTPTTREVLEEVLREATNPDLLIQGSTSLAINIKDLKQIIAKQIEKEGLGKGGE